jgi:hypothetical protein
VSLGNLYQDDANQMRLGMRLMRAKQNGKKYVNPVPAKVGGLSLIFKVGPRFFLGAAARSPKHSLGPFHTDPGVFATSPYSGLRITWMGHSTSLVEIDGIRLLIDPVWDERAAPMQWAGPKRFFSAPLALQDLPTIDAVVISHDHYDHLGAGTIRQLVNMPQLQNARPPFLRSQSLQKPASRRRVTNPRVSNRPSV